MYKFCIFFFIIMYLNQCCIPFFCYLMLGCDMRPAITFAHIFILFIFLYELEINLTCLELRLYLFV